MKTHPIKWYWPEQRGVQVSEHFKAGEFMCNRPLNPPEPTPISVETVERLELLRAEACDFLGHDAPVHLNSFYRNSPHNKAEKGASNSKHMLGCAADIVITGMRTEKLVELAYKVGFRRIGKAKTFIHVDTDEGEAYWCYLKTGTRTMSYTQMLNMPIV